MDGDLCAERERDGGRTIAKAVGQMGDELPWVLFLAKGMASVLFKVCDV